MQERIGVFVCRCGPNIGDKIYVDSIVNDLKNIESVVTAKSHNLPCSKEGLEFIKDEIKKGELTRIVVAGCTPKMYEQKFMDTCEEAGINPFLFQMTNIREQVAWVTPDKALATEKARKLCLAAIKRVSLQEPIERKEIEVKPDVLVVGGGVAGLEATLTLTSKGRKIILVEEDESGETKPRESAQFRKVYLVEKSPCIAGVCGKVEEVYQTMECAPCMLAPELQEVLQKENVETLTFSEVEEIVGSFGNFTVKIRRKARYVSEEACIGCSACFEPCPVEIPNQLNGGLSDRKAIYIPYPGALPNVPVIDRLNCLHLNGKECNACEQACAFGAINFEDKDEVIERSVGAIVLAIGSKLVNPAQYPQFGFGKYDNVLSAIQLERLNASNGPTSGKVLLKNGQEPESIAFIYCVGRKEIGYCSGICCMYMSAMAHHVKEKLPNVKIYSFYSDLCLPKKEDQKVFEKVLDKGVEFIRSDGTEYVDHDGKKLIVKYKTESSLKSKAVDMVVLAPPIEPSNDIDKLAKLLDIPLDEHGFFEEEHILMKPFGAPLEGIFIAGTCQGPKDIGDSVSQGSAAAGKILSRLMLGEKLELEPIVAEINEDICCGCNTCIGLCPFYAIHRDAEKNISIIDDTLCRGCGTCVAACPTGAAKAWNFTMEQISAEIREVAK
ncbi:MAG TPA: CoB--CoM heterodisulfide reductase iron-sulfur subunit A family protein [Candidatus Cloacimonetes bacterium]|nr:CoB--CoM heterodisulfide reductase iron-sulfur subunit A family protein [Candidatus Cloacimonadota bacterium]